jgi:hypothetical protein
MKQLQAQVELLAAVVKVLVAKLPPEAATRVRAALEDALLEQTPVSEDIDAATARLVAVPLGPYGERSAIAASRSLKWMRRGLSS